MKAAVKDICAAPPGFLPAFRLAAFGLASATAATDVKALLCIHALRTSIDPSLSAFSQASTFSLRQLVSTWCGPTNHLQA